jgi:hypothetical protein
MGTCDLINNKCAAGNVCVNSSGVQVTGTATGTCRNGSCATTALDVNNNCICPTIVSSCGGTCNQDYLCGGGYKCVNPSTGADATVGVCRAIGCPGNSGCVCSVCGNNSCESGETLANCWSDCYPIYHCGDGYCSRYMGESNSNCPSDCYCGNGSCESNEIQNNPYCKKPTGDCMSSCGAGGCQADKGENTTTCQYDCGSSK